MKIYTSVSQLVGNTPMLEITNYSKANNLLSQIYVKLEGMNPAGSVKDRVALSMINDAEQSGRLKPGGTIIEPTSGNTGIGLCAIGASRGYKVIIVMPDDMSEERKLLMKAYGATLVLTPGEQGMAGAIAKADELSQSIPDSIIAGQFSNPANPQAHYETTGPEIWGDMGGNIDIFVAGVGTGGTLSGTGKYLKDKNPDIRVVAVEPHNSPYLSKGIAGKHGLQGIGAGFIPETLDTSVYDEVIAVCEEDAYNEGRALAVFEGILVGISSGAALFAAKKIAERPENASKKIVVLLPDTGDRYLSTDMFKI
ncbi:MAG: cysteine synthase A [Ruminococcaceae bacterium]|nr:cysteine synthase A [Oscillospiraceae bacterium]